MSGGGGEKKYVVKREKKYAQKIPGGCGETSGQRARRGEHTAGKKTSKIAVQKILLLMAARKPVLSVHVHTMLYISTWGHRG